MRARCLLLGGIVAAALVPLACTREAMVRTVPALERGACIVLEGVTDDGTVRDVCATLEELAPVLAPLASELAARGEADAGAPPARIAFRIAVPRKKSFPRRRCAAWEELDGGPGTDASAR